MKQEFYFHIPQPCHEDWDKMTPAAKGRFCDSCSKQVVDFSLMSDSQVLNYFKNNTRKVCGRFANDQLQRPFAEAKEPKKISWWVAMLMPFMMFLKQDSKNKNIANQNVVTNDSIPLYSSSTGMILPRISSNVKADTTIQECTTIMGDIIREPDTLIINKAKILEEKAKTIGGTEFFNLKQPIKGKVVNEKGQPVPFANVSAKQSSLFTVADSIGNFQLLMNFERDSATIEASAIGYESNEIKTENQNIDVIITLKEKEDSLSDVTINAQNYLTGKVRGAIAVCVIKQNSITDTIRKIFTSSIIKLSPNPVFKGSVVHLEIKKTGEYSIQLFDNSSKLILVQDFVAASDNAITNINIPSSLAAGIYYVRVIDEKKKKQCTDKIIVQ